MPSSQSVFPLWREELLEHIWEASLDGDTINASVAEKLTLSGKPLEESDLRKLAACIQPDEGHLFSPEDTRLLMEGFLLLTETVSSLLDECDLKEEIFNQMIQQERNRDDACQEILRVVGDNDLWGALPVDEGNPFGD